MKGWANLPAAKLVKLPSGFLAGTVPGSEAATAIADDEYARIPTAEELAAPLVDLFAAVPQEPLPKHWDPNPVTGAPAPTPEPPVTNPIWLITRVDFDWMENSEPETRKIIGYVTGYDKAIAFVEHAERTGARYSHRYCGKDVSYPRYEVRRAGELT
jgi:hypothetical protein